MNHERIIRVMVTDDLPLVRRGIAEALETFDDMVVDSQAASGAEALYLCSWIQPNVVLIDLTMPGLDSVTTIQLIIQSYPAVQVIALAGFNERHVAAAVLAAGAYCYLQKDISAKTLAETIRMAHEAGNAKSHRDLARFPSLMDLE